MDKATKIGIGVAINEATLLGAEASREHCGAAITLAVLSLPPQAVSPPADPRVSLSLGRVGRIVASLRNARWDDDQAPAVPFSLEALLEVVRSFGGLPVYGWEFIDVEEGYARWSNRLSLDERFEGGGIEHSITLCQDGHDRILDLRIWFDELRVFRPDRSEVPLHSFIADGQRWWDGLYGGDPRTQGHGISPG